MPRIFCAPPAKTRDEVIKMNLLSDDGIPLGFGMALMQNPIAYTRFFELTPQRRESLISGAHNIGSKQEMKDYVNHIAVTD